MPSVGFAASALGSACVLPHGSVRTTVAVLESPPYSSGVSRFRSRLSRVMLSAPQCLGEGPPVSREGLRQGLGVKVVGVPVCVHSHNNLSLRLLNSGKEFQRLHQCPLDHLSNRILHSLPTSKARLFWIGYQSKYWGRHTQP